MNVLNKLSIKNLKMNKKRTISMIIGIILSMALICGVITLWISFKESLLQSVSIKLELSNINSSTMKTINTVTIILLIMIIMTSIFCIRNSFAISTTEKIKMYGMLSSVGTTKKQIKKSVLYEALILSLIGIPIGIIIGFLFAIILLKVANQLVGSFLLDGNKFIFKTSPVAIILSIILEFVTVYLSAISSAKKASKVSPIENLKNVNEITLNKDNLKTPKFIKKIFGVGGVIAYKNLKRSKKKYRTTIVSLTISIFIFIAMSSFVSYMQDMSNKYINTFKYNIEISSDNNISKEDTKKILNLGNIKESHIIYSLPKTSLITITDESKFNKVNDQIDKIYLPVIGLDQNTYNDYLLEVGGSVTNKKSSILYDYHLIDNKEYRTYKYHKGDTIKGTLDYNNEEFEITLNEVTKNNTIGFEGIQINTGLLLVNINDYQELPFNAERILVTADNAYQFERTFNGEFKNMNCDNYTKEYEEQKALALTISIFLYGFIILITLIGITNIFNTITSNIELRQKEFAMLKSIGMTKKEFNRIINLETIFYSSKSLISGIILGLIGVFFINKAFSMKLETKIYLPVKAIIISIVIVFFLVFIIMKYSVHKINKKNTIETIRNENV